MHCLMCTNGGQTHIPEYISSPKPDAFYEVIMTILQCSGRFSEFLFLCGTEDTILSILAISYTSINQTKYTAMKDFLIKANASINSFFDRIVTMMIVMTRTNLSIISMTRLFKIKYLPRIQNIY